MPLPRVGVRFAVPAALRRVEWFGRGPGEAYPDTRLAARIGRFAAPVEALQTPYLMPQENGSRADVRWAELTGGGAGLRLEGRPHFALTVRPWTSEALAAARHPTDLVPDPDRLWVNADHALQGIGTASCGPGVLPPYRLSRQAATLSAFELPPAAGTTAPAHPYRALLQAAATPLRRFRRPTASAAARPLRS